METLQLIQKLYHAETGMRRQAVLTVGMVQETSALGALEQRVREEPDDGIRAMIQWAGKRVRQAQIDGFTTMDAIFEHFKINRELASGIDPEEAELLRHQSYSGTQGNQGGMLSDIRLGSMLTADNIKTGRLGQRMTDKKSLLRLQPVHPTDTNISQKIKRLMDGSDAKRQKNAAIELRDINNPDALPYLALVFYRNENPEINDLIEQAGKTLYWMVNYATMDKNGRIKLEVAKRRREGNYAEPIETASHPVTPAQNNSVTDILNQAQRNRKRRRR